VSEYAREAYKAHWANQSRKVPGPFPITVNWDALKEEAKADWQAIIAPLVARLEAAEKDRNQLRAEVARLRDALEGASDGIRLTLQWIKSIGAPPKSMTSVTMSVATVIGIRNALAQSPSDWLAARDERMRREGAAEWLTGYIKGLLDMEPSEYKGAALAHLPEELARLKSAVEEAAERTDEKR
jgi:hypothetical protein